VARPRSVSSYRRHRQSSQAVVTLTDGLGGRRDVLLGKYGTKESRVEYARVIAKWEAACRCPPALTNTKYDITINELMPAYWRFARGCYGLERRKEYSVKYALAVVKELYGFTRAVDFGSLAFGRADNG
jgi:hypothetical protein